MPHPEKNPEIRENGAIEDRQLFRRCRQTLGLSAAKMDAVLQLRSRGRTTRLWEAGDRRIPGPVWVALRLMLHDDACRDAGVDLWQIAGWLGHTAERTTELYLHHHPDFLSGARRALD